VRSESPRGSRSRRLAAAATTRGKSSRAGASLGQQACCDIPARPSFALPGSTPFIQPSTAADLPNRQGPRLRTSSVYIAPASHKRLWPPVTPLSKKMDIYLYIGSNGTIARGSSDVTESAARDLQYHPEIGGARQGHRVKRTDRRCRCPNPHGPATRPRSALGGHRPGQVLDRHRQVI
jgi:hypothetical protein